MPKKRSNPKGAAKKSSPTKTLAKRPTSVGPSRNEYASVLTDLTQLIRDSRRRALATVNRELVCLYWHIGRTIVEQQETAHWGDAVVEQLATDLRAAFPDMKGLSRDNVFRMRQFFLTCRETDRWFDKNFDGTTKVGAARRQIEGADSASQIVGAAPRQFEKREKVATASPQSPSLISGIESEVLSGVIQSLSWTHHHIIMGACDRPDERYFYMAMSVRERWSVRELRRQIDAALFERYVSVKRDPEKCLPADAEHGDLMPFKDHYVLEFLGLEDEHSEKELRKAILGNLRDFFLEFGKDLTFVGEEYPLTVGADTFYIDLLFFHRRLQCLISVDLKIGKFKPEYAGKSQFYCAALDEQLRLPHENPSIGLVLCKTADHAQVRLALTAAARKIGIATYQTVLPDEHLLEQRLARLPMPQEVEPRSSRLWTVSRRRLLFSGNDVGIAASAAEKSKCGTTLRVVNCDAERRTTMKATMTFTDDFRELTGNPPFPWQESLYERFIAHCGETLRVANRNEEYPNNIPSSCNLPTGLGKTSVVAIWLIALANHPDRMPRRLVYVVNRRTVVDQTTTEVEKLRERLGNSPRLQELRKRLVDLCALPLDGKDEPLAISTLRGCQEFIVVRRSASQTHDAERRATLRGQFADNREWSADPARPAVIVGTVDMIGSCLSLGHFSVGIRHHGLCV